ncbi:hypothetical protein WR25_13772 [Diploscapter pachys]|uniref:Protein kinase domain-containing protein n=1 Tax=Diploscapter pachys TaxID=2018661 RepID=A0A2A2LJ76_9BILA|nr:hypothetical protein WR25_13772 [Diploscapter pachys]
MTEESEKNVTNQILAQTLHFLSHEIHTQHSAIQQEVQTLGQLLLESSDNSVLAENCSVTEKLANGLIVNRVCSLSWLASHPPPRWCAPLLKLGRILFRDKPLVENFHNLSLHSNYAQFFQYLVNRYQHNSIDWMASMNLTLNITQKFIHKNESAARFVQVKLYKSVLQLLNSNEMSIMQGSLEILGRLSDWSTVCRAELCASTVIDICLQLVPNGDLLTQKLCVSLLRILACEEQAREQIRIYDGVPALVSLLPVKNSRLLWHVAWALAQLAEDQETSLEIAQLGGISLILVEMTNVKVPERGLNDWIAMLTGLNALLAQLCQCDSNQQLIVNNNGVYILGRLLLQHIDNEKLVDNPAWHTLQCSIFRVLRLLFSLERNRHIFKKVFPAEFFEKFIDIGHYVQDLSAYRPLVLFYEEILKKMTPNERDAAWESVNQRREPLGKVGDYELIEQLGAGAFGCVYTVRKKIADHTAIPQYYALKEIFMTQVKEVDGDRSFGDVISEVKIIKQQLRHPNIVRYRRIFVENNRLYIVMDLIEGASLKEHINSVKEKREIFPENRIWNILIQMTLGLRYLHKDKHIVHRDLKPNNIMISDKDRVVITDFGLAKQKGNDYLKSAAGTIVYSCPEIVQNVPYGEKADVWSFGCCVHEMAALRPPFYSQNMLTLATQIVEAKYEPIKDPYSKELIHLIGRCLTADPSLRPDIFGVAALAAPRLLLSLDDFMRTHATVSDKSGEIKMEKESLLKREPSSSLNSSSNSTTGVFAKKRVSQSGSNDPTKDTGTPNRRRRQRSLLPNIDNGIDKVPRSRRGSGKSLSAGQVSNNNRGISLSCSLPRLNPTPAQGLQNRRVTIVEMETKKRAISSTDLRLARQTEGLSVRSAALRPVTDPVLLILSQIHRIFMTTSNTQNETIVNHKRRAVEQFKRRLFEKGSNPEMIKKHLRKLAVESQEEIELDLGYGDFRPVLANIHVYGYQIDQRVTRITYEQLANCIQSLLDE